MSLESNIKYKDKFHWEIKLKQKTYSLLNQQYHLSMFLLAKKKKGH